MLQMKSKGQVLNMLGRFHIHDLSGYHLQLNEAITETQNRTFHFIKYIHHDNAHSIIPIYHISTPHLNPPIPEHHVTEDTYPLRHKH
jgi:hypothetical protein